MHIVLWQAIFRDLFFYPDARALILFSCYYQILMTPWRAGPHGMLQSMGLQRVGHD